MLAVLAYILTVCNRLCWQQAGSHTRCKRKERRPGVLGIAGEPEGGGERNGNSAFLRNIDVASRFSELWPSKSSGAWDEWTCGTFEKVALL